MLALILLAVLFLAALPLLWLCTRKKRPVYEREPNKGYPGDMAVLVGCVIALLVDTIIGAPL